MIYTVTLNPALDRSVGPDGTRTDPGGKGLNVAKTLRAFGIPAAAVCLTAGTSGDILCQLSKAAGLNLLSVPTVGETRVNFKRFDGTTVTEHNAPGTAFDPDAFSRLRELLRQRLHPGDTLALCGSLPPKAPANCYALLALDHPGCHIIVDTSGPALTASMAANPDYIKPNLVELEQLAGRSLPDTSSRATAMGELLTCGAKRVLLSLGSEGALLATPQGVWRGNAPSVPIRGTVGAGDAMTAVLCHCPKDDPAALLRACIAAGSAAVMQPGSAPPAKLDWKALQKKITVLPV